MKRSIALFCVACLLLTGTIALAEDDAPRPWTPISANFGPAGTGVKPGMFSITDSFLAGDSDGVRKYSHKLNDTADVNRYLNVIKLRYGIMPGLDVRTATPIYSMHIDRATGSDRTNYGYGDTTVQLHKILLNQDQGDPLFLAADLGVVLPTGSVGEHSVNGIGSSAWGGVAGLGATYFLGSNRFDMEVQYALFDEGAKSFEKGDRFRWNAGYAYALNKMWDIGVESCYEWNAETELHGVGQKDQSTEWYYGPKVVFKYQPWGLNLGADVMLPAYRWYQNAKQGSDDYRVEFKLTKAFDIGTLFN